MKEVSATITSKGQITIPIEVRKRLHLSQGDAVTFVLEDDYAILKPAVNAVEATAGILHRPGPPLTATELREAAEEAIAEDRSGQ